MCSSVCDFNNRNRYLTATYKLLKKVIDIKFIKHFLNSTKDTQSCLLNSVLVKNSSVCLFVCFVALRPKSTAKVIAGRSVHLTTLFLGKLEQAVNQYIVHIRSLVTDNNPS